MNRLNLGVFCGSRSWVRKKTESSSWNGAKNSITAGERLGDAAITGGHRTGREVLIWVHICGGVIDW